MARTIGERVGALLKGDSNCIWLFGYGVYAGEQIPEPSLNVRMFGAPMDHANPCIVLDSGKKVYGCECWWAGEADVKNWCANVPTVIDVDIEEERRKVKA